MKKVVSKLWAFVCREPVLCFFAAADIVTMAFVPPSPAYLEYVDTRVLILLFCLMAVVAGLQDCGLFHWLAQRLLNRRKTLRPLLLTLVLLPFFCAMFITNDVALLTFVPFTFLLLDLTGQEHYKIYTVILQTIAANLGSMATPVGNPQNLFLYNHYQISAANFFHVMLPYAGISALLLTVAALCVKNEPLHFSMQQTERIQQPQHFVLLCGLFVLCLLAVFRILSDTALLAIILAVLLLFDRPLLKRVDYCLLLTFVCFFVFAGNMGQCPAVRQALTAVLTQHTLLTAVCTSQIISNLPAAVLLAPFTTDWRGLLLGVDIGGLGTPIASLASLISLKLYHKDKDARLTHCLFWFTAANFAGLGILLLLASFLPH